MHPFLTNDEVRAYGAEHGIATEAWSPIAQGAVLDDPTITTIAERVGKSAAQVTLRWHVQLGNIVFPKSITPERIKANFEIFDFELTDEDMALISASRPGRGRAHRPEPRHVRHGPRLSEAMRDGRHPPGCRPSLFPADPDRSGRPSRRRLKRGASSETRTQPR